MKKRGITKQYHKDYMYTKITVCKGIPLAIDQITNIKNFGCMQSTQELVA
jgi:hypothetical protein